MHARTSPSSSICSSMIVTTCPGNRRPTSSDPLCASARTSNGLSPTFTRIIRWRTVTCFSGRRSGRALRAVPVRELPCRSASRCAEHSRRGVPPPPLLSFSRLRRAGMGGNSLEGLLFLLFALRSRTSFSSNSFSACSASSFSRSCCALSCASLPLVAPVALVFLALGAGVATTAAAAASLAATKVS